VVEVTLEEEFGSAYDDFLAALEKAEAREKERVEEYRKRSALFGRVTSSGSEPSCDSSAAKAELIGPGARGPRSRVKLRRAVLAVAVTNRMKRFKSIVARPSAVASVSAYRSRRGSVHISKPDAFVASQVHDSMRQ